MFIKLGPTASFILLMALLFPGVSRAGDIVIIANENVSVSALVKEDIQQIFLGKKTTWDDGTKIVFAVQTKTETSEMFLKSYILKSPYQYDLYWKKQIFTGKGKAPKSFSSDQDIVAFVSETPGAIGYVSAAAVTGNTKTIPVR